MTTTWIGSGADCGCCTGGIECARCIGSIPLCWGFTLGTITGTNPVCCPDYSGDHLLSHCSINPFITCLFETSFINCVWASAYPCEEVSDDGTDNFGFWLVPFGLTGLAWRLFIGTLEGSPNGYYHCDSFDCSGSNVFSKVVVDICSGWPSTITVAPVECP